jgi:deoxyribose-phosphate aldolase
MEAAELARRIDAAYLKAEPASSVAALRQAADDAVRLGVRALVVPPVLAGTVKKNYPALKVAAVISYPLGLDSLATKIFALQELGEQRIDEVDIVLDLFALVNSNWRKLEQEAQRLGEACQEVGLYSKAIIEAGILTAEQQRSAAEILRDSPVDCIKTSTGYHREPATLEQVKLLRQVVGDKKRIKASGGIRTLYQAQTLLEAGADILGISQPAPILDELAVTA